MKKKKKRNCKLILMSKANQCCQIGRFPPIGSFTFYFTGNSNSNSSLEISVLIWNSSQVSLVCYCRSVQNAFYIKILYSVFGINILCFPFYIHTTYGCYFFTNLQCCKVSFRSDTLHLSCICESTRNLHFNV